MDGLKVTLTNNRNFDIELTNGGVTIGKIDKGGYSEDEATVAAGKSLIAASITQKGVLTTNTATFAQMASNINKILVGYGGSEVYELDNMDTLITSTNITTNGEVTT